MKVKITRTEIICLGLIVALGSALVLAFVEKPTLKDFPDYSTPIGARTIGWAAVCIVGLVIAAVAIVTKKKKSD